MSIQEKQPSKKQGAKVLFFTFFQWVKNIVPTQDFFSDNTIEDPEIATKSNR
jgi:hypothetical protein